MHRLPPRPPLFPYTTLFRSVAAVPAPVQPVEQVAAPESQPEMAAVVAAAPEAVPEALVTGNAASGIQGVSVLPRTGEPRSEEHTSELQSRENLVCRLLLEKK